MVNIWRCYFFEWQHFGVSLFILLCLGCGRNLRFRLLLWLQPRTYSCGYCHWPHLHGPAISQDFRLLWNIQRFGVETSDHLINSVLGGGSLRGTLFLLGNGSLRLLNHQLLMRFGLSINKVRFIPRWLWGHCVFLRCDFCRSDGPLPFRCPNFCQILNTGNDPLRFESQARRVDLRNFNFSFVRWKPDKTLIVEVSHWHFCSAIM